MAARYEKIVRKLREAFPKPISDRMHDAYFVFSFMRALDRVDAMKSASPILGEPEDPDFDAARLARMAENPSTLEEVSEQLVDRLSGMFIWGHPRSQVNVVPSPTIPSIIGGLLPSIYNPNLCSDESSRTVAATEIEVAAMTADLVGYDAARAAGVFTFGGTGTLMYAAKIGLEKACPHAGQMGLREPAVIVCSDHAHYACKTIANWMGLGEQNVIAVPTTEENEIRPCLLESFLRDALQEGRKIACIVATMGTTDAFGLDDLAAMHEIRDNIVDEFDLDYVPHLHADAVIGWAWSVFNEYDFEENPLEFRHRTVRALAGTKRRIQHLGLADSVGIDFHKTGFAPYISSLFIAKAATDLTRITRSDESMPYLFQSGRYHPGKFTLETSRSGSGPMAALANLLLFGRSGMQALLGHLVTMAEALREHLEGQPSTHVLNDANYGPVTIFRVYPDGIDTFSIPHREMNDVGYREKLKEHNEYNLRIFDIINREALEGRGVVISLTDCYRETAYGEPVVGLKSYIMSPFSEEKYVDFVIESIDHARDVERADSKPA